MLQNAGQEQTSSATMLEVLYLEYLESEEISCVLLISMTSPFVVFGLAIQLLFGFAES